MTFIIENRKDAFVQMQLYINEFKKDLLTRNQVSMINQIERTLREYNTQIDAEEKKLLKQSAATDPKVRAQASMEGLKQILTDFKETINGILSAYYSETDEKMNKFTTTIKNQLERMTAVYSPF